MLVHKSSRDVVKIMIDNNFIQDPKGEFTLDLVPLKNLKQARCIYYTKDQNKIGWCDDIFSRWSKEEVQDQCVIVTREGLVSKDVDK